MVVSGRVAMLLTEDEKAPFKPSSPTGAPLSSTTRRMHDASTPAVTAIGGQLTVDAAGSTGIGLIVTATGLVPPNATELNVACTLSSAVDAPTSGATKLAWNVPVHPVTGVKAA